MSSRDHTHQTKSHVSSSPLPARILDFHAPPATFCPEVQEEAVSTLEDGGIVLFSESGFRLTDRERQLLSDLEKLSPERSQKDRQNGRPTVMFDPERGRIRGRPKLAGLDELEGLLGRYSSWAVDLVERLLPAYTGHLARDRVTYRPVPRNKTQGLHVDASYLRPHRGRGMLRVFCNLDPAGEPRVWRVGEEPFEAFARHFLPTARTAVPARVRFLDWVASWVGLADRRATPCDHLMADIRAQAKKDNDFQSKAPQRVISFPASAAWVAFTDVVLHGAVSGRHSVDQIFFLPADAMQTPARSSLRTLERLTGLDLERG
jgi:hypothetical protein